ncbi:MAG: hypothetical protein ACRETH_05460, partial [Steroidobacteraceae bacterium]
MPKVTCFAIQRRVDVAGMKTERLIDLSRPRRKSFGDGAARRVEVSGNRHKTADDAFLEVRDPAVQRLG